MAAMAVLYVIGRCGKLAENSFSAVYNNYNYYNIIQVDGVRAADGLTTRRFFRMELRGGGGGDGGVVVVGCLLILLLFRFCCAATGECSRIIL